MKTSFVPAIDGSPTVIISGFPGIGKTTAMNLNDGYNGDHLMDSDSSRFAKEYFPQNYFEHIYYAVKVYRPDILFVSSHDIVRASLIEHKFRFSLAYPDIKLRGEYIQRYTDRGSPDPFLKLLFEKWNEWVADCQYQKGCEHFELKQGEYLSQLIITHIL